jgi:PAS domain S-box-containing protein
MKDAENPGSQLKLPLVPAGLFALTFDEAGEPCFLYASARCRQMLDLPAEGGLDAGTSKRLCHGTGLPEFLRMKDTSEASFMWEGNCTVGGKHRWFRVEAAADGEGDGPRTWHGVMTDFTAQKEAEENLRRILENLPIPVLAADFIDLEQPGEDVKVRLLNKRWLATFGHTIEDAPTVAQLTELLFPTEEASREILAWWRQALQNVEPGSGAVETRESRMRCKDGTDRDVIINATLLPSGPVTAFQDITVHKRAEQALHESHQMMSLAADAAGIGFWNYDLATKESCWDDRMLEIFGISREDFTNDWSSFVHPDDIGIVEDTASEAVARCGRYDQEFRIIRPDGAIRHLRAIGMVTTDKEGHPQRLIGVNYDVTSEKNAEERLLQAHLREKRLEEAHRKQLERKLRTSLAAAAVIHEIKQPLSALLLEGYLALEHLQPEGPSSPGKAFLHSTVARAEQVVETADKIQSLLHSVQTDPSPVNLGDVARSAIRFTKEGVARGEIKLEVEGLQGRALDILGDEGQLLVATSNLLRNACHAVAGQKAGERKILLALRRFRENIELIVGDNGPGLPSRILEKIPLFTTKPEGTGLGLFLVQAVAENHGATLVAGRSPLGGAELKLVFPVEPAD